MEGNKSVKYQLCWLYYDYFSECEYQRSAIFSSEEMANMFAKDNELGCWWVNRIEVEG